MKDHHNQFYILLVIEIALAIEIAMTHNCYVDKCQW